MRVSQEILTIIPDPERREVSVVLAGLRVTLSIREAQTLRRGLNVALAGVQGVRPIELPVPLSTPAAAAGALEAVGAAENKVGGIFRRRKE